MTRPTRPEQGERLTVLPSPVLELRRRSVVMRTVGRLRGIADASVGERRDRFNEWADQLEAAFNDQPTSQEGSDHLQPWGTSSVRREGPPNNG